MMSEKAKGKQRAIDPSDPVIASSTSLSAEAEQPTRVLVVRFTEGIPDFTLPVQKKHTVRNLKDNIRKARPQLISRRLRLIHSGRLLTDGTFLYDWIESLEERQKRAVSDYDHEGTSAEPATIFLHCSVGPKVDDGEGENDEGKVQSPQIQPLRGFDRLVAAGFSEADIANFRRQFHSQASADYLDTAEFETEEEYDEHARALEEQWIDSLDNSGTASLSQSSSSSSSLMQGLVVGFFFPILPLFFTREPKPAVFWEDGSEFETTGSVVFSRRMQIGLVVGFIINILFGTWRYLLDMS